MASWLLPVGTVSVIRGPNFSVFMGLLFFGGYQVITVFVTKCRKEMVEKARNGLGPLLFTSLPNTT